MFRNLIINSNLHGLCRRHLLTNSYVAESYSSTRGKLLHPVYSYPPRRFIFSEHALAIPNFLSEREKRIKKYSPEQIDEFFEKMDKNLSSKTPGIIFMQDLQNAVYICPNDENKLAILNNMLTKYCTQSSGVRFGRFSFGAVLMRLCYHMDLPQFAQEITSDNKKRQLFSDGASYQLLLSLLYKNEMYEELLDTLDKVISERLAGQNHPKSCITIGLAAVLRMDTPEGYTRGVELVESTIGRRRNTAGLHKRLIALACCVLLKAGRPQLCLQLLINNPWPTYPLIQNLMIIAWCEVGDISEALSLSRSLVSVGTQHDVNKRIVYRNVYNTLVEAVKNSGSPDYKEELQAVQRSLVDGQQINDEDCFAVALAPVYSLDPNKTSMAVQDSFNRGSHERVNVSRHRNQRRMSSLMDTLDS